MFIRNGQPFDITSDQMIGDVQYPRGYFYDEQMRLNKLIFPVDPTDPPAATATQKVVTTGYSQDPETWRWTAVYSVINMTEDEIAAAAAALADLKAQLINQVDSHFASIYLRWFRFEPAYVAREAAAQAFKDGGYAGTADAWITDFSSQAGLSATAATDLILAQANGLRAALKALDGVRMKKYGITAATTATAAQAVCNAIIAQANSIAAGL